MIRRENLHERSLKLVESYEVRGSSQKIPPTNDWRDEAQKYGLEGWKYTRANVSGEHRVVLPDLPFLLYRPKESLVEGDTKSYPILIYFSGTGDIGTDEWSVLIDGYGAPMHLMNESFQKFLPCYVMVPQSNKMSEPWTTLSHLVPGMYARVIVQAIDLLHAKKFIRADMTRQYVTGASAGAFGVFDVIAKMPGRFAAGVPVAANGGWGCFGKANARPMWLSYNTSDTYNARQKLIDKLKIRYKTIGMEPRIEANKDVQGHYAWTWTYSSPNFRRWLQRQKLDKPT